MALSGDHTVPLGVVSETLSCAGLGPEMDRRSGNIVASYLDAYIAASG